MSGVLITEGEMIPAGHPQEFSSMTEALHKENVLEITRNEDGKFVLVEGGDRYFYIVVSPDQLRLLGEELIALAAVVEGEG